MDILLKYFNQHRLTRFDFFFIALLFLLSLVISPLYAASGDISTVAGNGVGDGLSAREAKIRSASGIDFDSSGNLYIADASNYRIRKIDAVTGIMTTVAGTGVSGGLDNKGDGGDATLVNILPTGVAIDSANNIYLTNWNTIRRVDAVTGVITTIAGNGQYGCGYDGILATATSFTSAADLAFDSGGNLYITDLSCNNVRRVDAATGIITTVAGTRIAGYSGDGGPAVDASLDTPRKIALDSKDNLYISDTGNSSIRQVNAMTGIITTIATVQYAIENNPYALTVDASDNLYFVDGNRVRQINTLTGIVTLVAGSGDWTDSGDGGDATLAGIAGPSSLAVDTLGNLHIGTRNHVRMIDGDGIITTYAGQATTDPMGDGSSATLAILNRPRDVEVDANGNIYIVDTDNHRVRKVDAITGNISTYVGNGLRGSPIEGYDLSYSKLNYPFAMTLDPSGNIFIANTYSHTIWRVDIATGLTTKVAGVVSSPGNNGDGGNANSARLNSPEDIALDSAGNLYIADYLNHRVRMVDAATGVITTVAGNGVQANLYRPSGVALDNKDNLYISDTYNNRIRRVDAKTKVITTVAGNGTSGYSGDGGPATLATLARPTKLVFDNAGNLYFSDAGNSRVRKIDAATGTISTVAGTDIIGPSGDDGIATLTKLRGLMGITIDSSNNLYVTEYGFNRIRKIELPDSISPTGSIVINGGTAYTNNVSVTLSLNCSDNKDCTELMLSSDGVTAGTWQPYTATTTWTLPAGDGSKTIYVKYRDAAANESIFYSDSINLDTSNTNAPTAVITSGDTFYIQKPEVFDASLSVDPNGDPLVFDWDFGDGTPITRGVNVSHFYTAAGTYTVSLFVNDGINPPTVATKVVTVLTGAPTAVMTSGDTFYIQKPEVFDASLSIDPNGDPLVFDWDFGDGTLITRGVNVSHFYTAAGTYTVSLFVNDGINPPTIATKVVTVLTGAPTAVMTSGDTFYIQKPEIFDASLSIDPNGDPLVFDWDFGDGTLITRGVNVSHFYTAAGTYTVSLFVNDGINPPTIATKVVTVLTGAPTAVMTSGDTFYIQKPEVFDASLSIDPNGDPLVFDWDFGDGTLITRGVNVSHFYTAAGTYTVSLFVNDGINPPTIATKVVTVLTGAPTAVMTSGDTFYIQKPEVFDASLSIDPNGDPLVFDWDFGDGTLITRGVNVSHFYTAAGTYTVSLFVNDGINPPTIATKVVTVLTGAPLAQFTSTDSTFINTPEIFDASLTTDPNGDPLIFSWNFGDTTSGTGATVTHTYATAGTYTVTLDVYDGNNPLVTVTKDITVLTGAPLAQFTSMDSTFINTPEIFDASLTTDPNGDPLSFSWSFGDTTTGTGATVTHTYATAGTYTVTLNVYDGNNPLVTVTKDVTVLTGAPLAQFTSANSTFINTPEVFDASLTTDPNGDPLIFSWNFGDTTSGTGATVTHTYATAGTYTVTLNVYDGNNPLVTVTKDVTVLTGAPLAQFTSANSTFINTPEVFDASLTTDPNGDPLIFSWNFGDTTSGTGATVTHTYATAGTYTVTLDVYDGNNPLVTVTKDVIVLTGAPLAQFTSTDSTFINTPEVFDASLTTDPNGDPLVFSWNFGDTTSGTGVTVTHTYATAGTYTVTLDVFDGNNPLVTVTKDVIVLSGAPTAVITSLNSINKNESISFDASLSTDPNGDPLTYSWDFGDGFNSPNMNVNHTYTSSGDYTVTLTVSDGYTPITVSKVVTVLNQSPLAVITSSDTIDKNVSASFDASLSSDPNADALTYSWDFGDGTLPVAGAKVNHVYTVTGSYTITLTVSDGETSNSTSKLISVVNQAPIPEITSSDTVDRNVSMVFDASLSSDPNGDSLTYSWDFGDGTTATGVRVNHAYSVVGTIVHVTLTVSDGEVSVSQRKSITLINHAPTSIITSPDVLDKNIVVSFDASLSTDSDGDTLYFHWDFGDGGLTSSSMIAERAYTKSGTYTVTLTVISAGASSSSSKVVTVVNQTPIPVITALDSVNKNIFTNFDASLTRDNNSDALSYNWDLGDGTTATGGKVNYAYTTSGIYTVKLTASDGESTASISKTITVLNQSPVANAGVDQIVSQKSTIRLDGNLSSDPDVGDSIVSYQWTQLSGNPVTLINGTGTVAAFEAPRIKGVKFLELVFELTVTDEEGLVGKDTVLVTVNK